MFSSTCAFILIFGERTLTAENNVDNYITAPNKITVESNSYLNTQSDDKSKSKTKVMLDKLKTLQKSLKAGTEKTINFVKNNPKKSLIVSSSLVLSGIGIVYWRYKRGNKNLKAIDNCQVCEALIDKMFQNEKKPTDIRKKIYKLQISPNKWQFIIDTSLEDTLNKAKIPHIEMPNGLVLGARQNDQKKYEFYNPSNNDDDINNSNNIVIQYDSSSDYSSDL